MKPSITMPSVAHDMRKNTSDGLKLKRGVFNPQRILPESTKHPRGRHRKHPILQL